MKTTNLYVGFDPYFGVTILILAFSVFVYLVFQHNKVVKSRSDLPKNNFIQFQSPSGYLILEYDSSHDRLSDVLEGSSFIYVIINCHMAITCITGSIKVNKQDDYTGIFEFG